MRGSSQWANRSRLLVTRSGKREIERSTSCARKVQCLGALTWLTNQLRSESGNGRAFCSSFSWLLEFFCAPGQAQVFISTGFDEGIYATYVGIVQKDGISNYGNVVRAYVQSQTKHPTPLCRQHALGFYCQQARSPRSATSIHSLRCTGFRSFRVFFCCSFRQ